MVCEDCKSKLSVISAPDPWRDGSRGGSGARKLNENKLLRKGVRSNPYASACRICKLKTQQNAAIYCTICAYAKGLCAICGKQVLDTSMYKMSEGGNQWHTVRQREGSAFKSSAQLAREDAIATLQTHLESTGQVGRMPTRAALEQAGQKELVETLVQTYGGLHAAADALGLSKSNLIDEAARRKEAKMHKAQQAAAGAQPAAASASASASGANADADADAAYANAGASVPGDAPPGIAAAATSTSASTSALAAKRGGGAGMTPAASASATPAAAAAATTTATAAGGGGGLSGDSRWQFDPNSGYYYQLSSGCYYDAKCQLYFKDGTWSATVP